MPQRSTIRSGFCLGAILSAIVSSSPAQSAEPSPDERELLLQVQALRAEVAELKASSRAPAYTAHDVDRAVASVFADSDRRSSLLSESGGFMGGYGDDKFTIRSADGNFSLSPGLWFQFRSVTNFNEGGKSSGRDQTENGLEVRRLKFSLDGNAGSKNLTYAFIWATDRKTGNLINEEAWVRWQLVERWAVKAGNYKEKIFQETATSPKRKLAVDVSLIGQALFGGDTFSQGIELGYDTGADGPFQSWLGVTDGYGSVNTNFQDPPANGFDFGVYGRAQYKLFGDWKSYLDQTARSNAKDLLVIGAGFDWSQNGDVNVMRHAADVQYEMGALGLFAAWVGKYTRRAAGDDSWDQGLLLQAGYLINPQWELFARYDYLRIDDAPGATSGDYHELTGGVNYYLRGHALKITLDVGWLPNGSPANFDAIGILANDGASQVYVRAQFQLIL